MNIQNKKVEFITNHHEISKDLIRKSNKFLKFIKILTGDLSDYIYDKRICKTRKKNKKELSWRVGSRIMNNFMEYYNEDCIENFGILFNAISSISTTNKLNDFVFEDLFTMLNDHIDQDTWHKIVTFKYQKINKKTNMVKEAYNPIDRCIFKSNISLVRSLINKLKSCNDYKNNNNESLIEIIDLKLKNIKENKFEGDYLMTRKISNHENNKNSLNWYNDENIKGLVSLKDFINKRMNDENENNLSVKQYIPIRVQKNLLKIHIIIDLLKIKMKGKLSNKLQENIFNYYDDYQLIKKYKIKKEFVLEKYGTDKDKYFYNFIKNKGRKENLKKENNENKENKINNYYESNGLYFKKIESYGNCNIFSEIQMKGIQLKKISNGTHIFIMKDKKQVYGSVNNNMVRYF